EALHALIDYAFTDLSHEALQAGARVTNPASRRVLEKCGFQWTGVGLYRINSIKSSAPIDRFRLERGIWSALKTWGRAKRGMETGPARVSLSLASPGARPGHPRLPSSRRIAKSRAPRAQLPQTCCQIRRVLRD